MATPSEAIAALESALASGRLTVEYDGRRVTYRSFAEIQSAIAYFRKQTNSKVPPVTYGEFHST